MITNSRRTKICSCTKTVKVVDYCEIHGWRYGNEINCEFQKAEARGIFRDKFQTNNGKLR